MDRQFVNKDWHCNSCGTNNFKNKTHCFGCGAKKPFEKKQGDWDCEYCNKSNFASRVNCFGCNRPRKRGKDGDWVCGECGDYQFAKNKTCRKCKVGKKPIKQTCGICYDETTEGIQCRSFHFTCNDCLNGDISANGLERIDKNGVVSCLYPHCDNHYDPVLATKHIKPQEFMRIIREHTEREVSEQAEKRIKQVLDNTGDEILANRHYKYITDKILSLSCPRCDMVFVDFDGCCALKCNNCSCGFCAWCLTDCGRDAHSHVAKCPKKPPGGDVFFASKDSIKDANEKLKKRKIKDYWEHSVDDKCKKILKPRLEGLVTI